MDRERARITAEAYGIRSRGWLRAVLQVVGVAAVLVGAYNFLVAPYVVTGAVAPAYRDLAATVIAVPSQMLADILLMVIGAIVAWFT